MDTYTDRQIDTFTYIERLIIEEEDSEYKGR